MSPIALGIAIVLPALIAWCAMLAGHRRRLNPPAWRPAGSACVIALAFAAAALGEAVSRGLPSLVHPGDAMRWPAWFALIISPLVGLTLTPPSAGRAWPWWRRLAAILAMAAIALAMARFIGAFPAHAALSPLIIASLVAVLALVHAVAIAAAEGAIGAWPLRSGSLIALAWMVVASATILAAGSVQLGLSAGALAAAVGGVCAAAVMLRRWRDPAGRAPALARGMGGIVALALGWLLLLSHLLNEPPLAGIAAAAVLFAPGAAWIGRLHPFRAHPRLGAAVAVLAVAVMAGCGFAWTLIHGQPPASLRGGGAHRY